MTDEEPPQKRRERYLRHAQEADELASLCHDPRMAASFRAIARSWERLAGELKDK